MDSKRKVVIKNLDIESGEDFETTTVDLELSDDPKASDLLSGYSPDLEDIEDPEVNVDYQDIEDVPDEEAIWSGGPLAGTVKDWKKQYGDIYVTSITYDKHIVWRVLNRAEYKQIVKKMEQLVQAGQLTTAEANLWNEETISELCMLYPKFDKNNAVGFMAGLPSLIAQELVFALESKYGNIYSVDVKGQSLVFRELTFKEYNKILYLQGLDGFSSADMEDLILSYAIIHPEDFDLMSIPPGAVSSLSQEILDISGFFTVSLAKSVLEEKRYQATEVKNLMKAFVLATISTYTPDDLENMTFSELAENVALSEKIIEIKQNMNGMEATNLTLQLIDPEEEVQKQKVSAARHNLSKKEGEAAYQDPIAQKLWSSG